LVFIRMTTERSARNRTIGELNMDSRFRLGLAAGALCLAGTVSYAVGLAVAADVPEMDPLVFTGLIVEDGQAVDGDHDLVVEFWRSPDSTDAGDRVCFGEASGTSVTAGRYRIPVPNCVEPLQVEQELYSELIMDGRSIGRTKVGAMPFALTAGGAERASEARAASGSNQDFHVPQNLGVAAGAEVRGSSVLGAIETSELSVAAATLRVGVDGVTRVNGEIDAVSVAADTATIRRILAARTSAIQVAGEVEVTHLRANTASLSDTNVYGAIRYEGRTHDACDMPVLTRRGCASDASNPNTIDGFVTTLTAFRQPVSGGLMLNSMRCSF
jgi:hypothetical protein